MGTKAQVWLVVADRVSVTPVQRVDLKMARPSSSRSGTGRQDLVAAASRMLVLAAASLPTFAVVAMILWPYGDREGIQTWFAACVGLSIASATVTVTRWTHLSLLTTDGVRQSLVWLFGIPMVLQWGSASFMIRPTTEHGALIMAMVVLIAATAVCGAAGAAFPTLTLWLVALIVGPNVLVTVVDFGALSVPSMLILYGIAMTLAVGLIARRELAQREALIARSEELLKTATTEQSSLTELNAELHFRATHDILMGIPNRELFRTELQAALDSSAPYGRRQRRVGLLFLDLDRFKFVNDTHGHQAGDALLVMVGARIQAALADEDALVARVGGDELVVLMRCLESDNHLGLVADKLLAKFVNPFTIEGVELNIGSSIGMAGSVVGETADDLYRHADAALYEAKQAGRGQAVLADRRLRNKHTARMRTESALRSALSEHEIEAWFQPEVDLYTGEVVGGEALARWRLGDEVAIAGSFIESAERAGLLQPLMFEMCDQVWNWRNTTASRVPMSINIATGDLPALLARHEASPCERPLLGLRLEIAERAIIGDFQRARVVLQRARDLGAEIILDDFGSGSSSLSMLSDLPIDGLKIHRSYVARVEHDVRVQRLVTSLAEFGRSCSMRIVAEGVETASQAEFLMQIGIDRGQGQLFSPAVEADRFDELVVTGCRGVELTGLF